MSKELEALKGIKMSIARHLSKQTGFSVTKHYELLQYDTQTSIVEKALTPPTERELCVALNRWLEAKEIYFDDNKNIVATIEFEFKTHSRDKGVKLSENTFYVAQEVANGYIFNCALPPHLITMIGRFYEKESERE